MKTLSGSLFAVLSALLLVLPASGSDVEAKVRFTGMVRNGAILQTVQGNYSGEAKVGFLRLKVKINGNVRTKVKQRPTEGTIYGTYPVDLYVKGKKGVASASKTFSTKVILQRNYMELKGYGRIKFDRPIDARKSGTQKLTGKGTLRYNLNF